MLLLSAADVAERHDEEALARLDEQPGLREAFEVQREETRLERRTLYYDAVTGWRFVDLCDLCGADLGLLPEQAELAALCETCEEDQRALADEAVAGHEPQWARAG